MPEHERRDLERRGQERATAFDRVRVFDDLFSPRTEVVPPVRLPGERAAESV